MKKLLIGIFVLAYVILPRHAFASTVSILVVGGGGGGGQDPGWGYQALGGGGGGGVIYNPSYAVTPQAYTVTVGAGGSGASGSNGGDSIFSALDAVGGGAGSVFNGTSGGSGGGGGDQNPGVGASGTAGQGNGGGTGSPNYASFAGGGGGCGAAGANYSGSNSGSGGIGCAYSISGSSAYYGGGGGGGVEYGSAGSGGSGGGGNGGTDGNGAGAAANTGGGGGGDGDSNATTYASGNGGSGIVIISAPTGSLSVTCSGCTTTTSGGNTIWTFDSSGTWTLSSSSNGNGAGVPSGTPLSGWAWSSNIGWISFDSTDSGTGTNGSGSSVIAYGVDLSTSSPCSTTAACLNGYAWSSNVGWVSFNSSDLATAPACPGGSGAAATVNLTTGAVTGFARVLSGTAGPTGWDGCVALSGTNFSSPDASGYEGTSTKGVSIGANSSNAHTYGIFSGFAWEPLALGWINFAPAIGNGTVVNCPGCGGTTPTPISITCSLTPPSNNLPSSGVGNVSGSITISGLSDSTHTYEWLNEAGTIESPQSASNGTVSITIPYNNPNNSSSPVTYDPIARVLDSGGNVVATSPSACGTVTVAAASGPSTGVKLLITPSSVTPPSGVFTSGVDASLQIKSGQTFNLGWNVDLTSDYTCTQSVNNGSWPSWSGEDFSSVANGNQVYGNLSSITASTPGTFQFTLTCTSNVSNPREVGSVNLNVTSSTEGEI